MGCPQPSHRRVSTTWKDWAAIVLASVVAEEAELGFGLIQFGEPLHGGVEVSGVDLESDESNIKLATGHRRGADAAEGIKNEPGARDAVELNTLAWQGDGEGRRMPAVARRSRGLDGNPQ